MITQFYKYSPFKRQKITRQKRQQRPFIIPHHHFIDNSTNIAHLKAQSHNYQSQFTFIQNQIERYNRIRKEKNGRLHELDKEKLKTALIFNHQNKDREKRRRELGVSSAFGGLKSVVSTRCQTLQLVKEGEATVSSDGVNRMLITNNL